jgi:hypothetical protein
MQPINQPADYLGKVDAAIEFWRLRQAPVHHSWLQAAFATLNEIRAYRQFNNGANVWANWNFKIPEYVSDDRWVQWRMHHGWTIFTGDRDSFVYGFYPSPPRYIPPSLSAAPVFTPGPIPARVFGSERRSSFLQHEYFTIASVADNGWVVDPNTNDGTVDVYDLQGKQTIVYVPSNRCTINSSDSLA